MGLLTKHGRIYHVTVMLTFCSRTPARNPVVLNKAFKNNLYYIPCRHTTVLIAQRSSTKHKAYMEPSLLFACQHVS